jgi:hypothetical protein
MPPDHGGGCVASRGEFRGAFAALSVISARSPPPSSTAWHLRPTSPRGHGRSPSRGPIRHPGPACLGRSGRSVGELGGRHAAAVILDGNDDPIRFFDDSTVMGPGAYAMALSSRLSRI